MAHPRTISLTGRLHMPVVFAHGFQVINRTADVCYIWSRHHGRFREAGIAWDDPDVGIEWPVRDPIVSERDRRYATLASIRPSLTDSWGPVEQQGSALSQNPARESSTCTS